MYAMMFQMVGKALYAFSASRPDELSFPKDAIITGVVKQDGEWWIGATASLLPFLHPLIITSIILNPTCNPTYSPIPLRLIVSA